jgi:hypothetical protein
MKWTNPQRLEPMENPPSKPTPEQLAALERTKAKYRTPEQRAEQAMIRENIESEFPPKSPSKQRPNF